MLKNAKDCFLQKKERNFGWNVQKNGFHAKKG
jgi:hypothetical protein